GMGEREVDGHRPAERVSEQMRTLDSGRVEDLQQRLGRIVGPGSPGPLRAEAGEVHCEGPMSRLEEAHLRGPHASVEREAVQESNGRPAAAAQLERDHGSNLSAGWVALRYSVHIPK